MNGHRPRSLRTRMRALATGDPEWHHYDELYRTTFGQEAASD